MESLEDLEFSISATSRPPREGELDGRDYYFISVSEFQDRIEHNEFIEWEQVYPQKYYGTLKSEIQRIKGDDKVAILDIDVLGAVNIKNQYQDRAVAVFIAPPGEEVVRERLINRGTETPESIAERMDRMNFEMEYKDKFDYTVINDDLDKATEELIEIFRSELESGSF